MRVFISSDIEGTAGIVDWEQVRGPGAEYEIGRQLLTDEDQPANPADVGRQPPNGRQLTFAPDDRHHRTDHHPHYPNPPVGRGGAVW